jgi:hypothetical protein
MIPKSRIVGIKKTKPITDSIRKLTVFRIRTIAAVDTNIQGLSHNQFAQMELP